MRVVSVIDCGTTNSRVYLVDQTGRVLAWASRKVGVRDTAIHGSNSVLKEGLRAAFLDAVERAGLTAAEVGFVVASGMITSELGLVEVPHLWAPAGIEELAGSLHCARDTAVFPFELPVYFVRGIKNRYDPQTVTVGDVHLLDFMRGEETQVIGLLAEEQPALPLTVVVLSSHTKFIAVDGQQRILGSVTTLSGQLYEAILKETSIGKSIRPEEGQGNGGFFDARILDIAHATVMSSGFLRSLMMPRFLDTLLETQWYERELYVEAAIAAEDLQAISQYQALGFPRNASIVLVGSDRRCAIYEYLLRSKVGIDRNIGKVADQERIANLGIAGGLQIARKAGLLD